MNAKMPRKNCSNMKNLLKVFLIFTLAFSVLAEETPINKPAQTEEIVLKGSVERAISAGTPMKLKIVSLPMSQEAYLDNWDLEGNFIPPKEGDPIVSELTEPILVSGDLVLPKGTKFFGNVSKVIAPKHFGRDGNIQIAFKGLQTPKGKTLEFKEANLTQSKNHLTKGQNIARGAARLGSFASGGAAAGALVAYQVAGVLALAVQPQYILASGAGIGLLIGTIASVVKKGKAGHLMPGDELKINLEQSLVLPVAEPLAENKPVKFAVSGLNLKIISKKLLKDELGSFNYLLDLEIENNTGRQLSGSDFMLLGPYNRQIMPSGLSLDFKINNLLSQTIKPNNSAKGQIAFELDFPSFEHILVFKDHFSQQMIYQETIGIPSNYIQNTKLQNFKEKIFGQGSSPWE